MDKERLERIGDRLAAMNENLANSPNAFALSAGEAVVEEVSAGISLASGESVYTANCSSYGARGQATDRCPPGFSLSRRSTRMAST